MRATRASDGANGSSSERGPGTTWGATRTAGRQPSTGVRAEDLLDPEPVLVTTGARTENRRGAELGDHGHGRLHHVDLVGEPPHPDPVGRGGEEHRVVGEKVEAGPDQGHRQRRLAASARPRQQHAVAVEREPGGMQRIPLESLQRLDQRQRQQWVGGQHGVTGVRADDRHLDESFSRCAEHPDPLLVVDEDLIRLVEVPDGGIRGVVDGPSRTGRLGGQSRSPPGPRRSTDTPPPTSGAAPSNRSGRRRESTRPATDTSSHLTPMGTPPRSYVALAGPSDPVPGLSWSHPPATAAPPR